MLDPTGTVGRYYRNLKKTSSIDERKGKVATGVARLHLQEIIVLNRDNKGKHIMRKKKKNIKEGNRVMGIELRESSSLGEGGTRMGGNRRKTQTTKGAAKA